MPLPLPSASPALSQATHCVSCLAAYLFASSLKQVETETKTQQTPARSRSEVWDNVYGVALYPPPLFSSVRLSPACLGVTHKGLRLKLAEKSVILSFGLACGVLMIFLSPLSLSLSLSQSWQKFSPYKWSDRAYLKSNNLILRDKADRTSRCTWIVDTVACLFFLPASSVC